MLNTLKLVGMLCIVQICAMACLASEPNNKPATDLLTWGVTPLANGRLHLIWAKPVIENLTKRTGLKVEFASARNLSLFLESVVRGEYDVVNLPLHIALYLMHHHNFKPVVRLKANANIILISKKLEFGGGFTDLSRMSLVLPDRISMAGFLAQDYFLSQDTNISVSYTDNHWQVVEEVLKGQEKIGAVVNTLLDVVSAGTRQQITVLHSFETEWVLANIMLVRPGTSEILIKRLQYGLEGEYPNSPIYEIEAVSKEDLNRDFNQLDEYVEIIRERMPQLHM